MVNFGIFRIMLVLPSIFKFIYHIPKIWIQNHIKIKEELELENSLIDSESDENHLVVFTRQRINIIDSDDEFSTELSDEENSGPQKQFRDYG